MSIRIKPNKSAKVRALKDAKPNLGLTDLARLAGVDISLVKSALGRKSGKTNAAQPESKKKP